MTGGGDAAGDAAGAAGAVSLADLEQRMSGAAVPTAPAAPGPDDRRRSGRCSPEGRPRRRGLAAPRQSPPRVTMPRRRLRRLRRRRRLRRLRRRPQALGGGGRAARVLDQIEAAAGVTPVDGAGSRDVFWSSRRRRRRRRPPAGTRTRWRFGRSCRRSTASGGPAPARSRRRPTRPREEVTRTQTTVDARFATGPSKPPFVRELLS